MKIKFGQWSEVSHKLDYKYPARVQARVPTSTTVDYFILVNEKCDIALEVMSGSKKIEDSSADEDIEDISEDLKDKITLSYCNLSDNTIIW